MTAVYLPAISVSPSYPHPLSFKRRRLSAVVKLKCLGPQVDIENNSCNYDSRIHWENFYDLHQNKFFKDRHYLEKDWGQYFCNDNANERLILFEAGCGAGNTIFPLAKSYPQLFVHACDFSHHAISLVKSNPKFREDQMNVFVCNIAEDNLCDHVAPASVDVVTLVFTLSAVSPEKMPTVIQNIRCVLKPNGHVLLRDYAIGDYAQEMLMNKNQVISENLYFRGDGTSSFYFSEDHLSNLFVRAGFSVVDVNTYNREIKNRARNITMQRDQAAQGPSVGTSTGGASGSGGAMPQFGTYEHTQGARYSGQAYDYYASDFFSAPRTTGGDGTPSVFPMEEQ